MRQHLVNLIKKKKNQKRNPWFDELWNEISAKPEYDPNLTHFKIDSKVENVMNVAVLYRETFKQYSKAICPQLTASCIHSSFNGKNFFNNYILNAKGENCGISIFNFKLKIALQIFSQFLEVQRLIWTVVGTPHRDMPSTSWMRISSIGRLEPGTTTMPTPVSSWTRLLLHYEREKKCLEHLYSASLLSVFQLVSILTSQ